MPDIRQTQSEMVHLHALTQGAVELFDSVKHDASPASNALNALLQVIVERADALCHALDEIEASGRAEAKRAA